MRYREHHPEATRQDVVRAWHWGTLLKPEVVMRGLGRSYHEPGDVYVLSPDKRGIFVGSQAHREQPTLITYLRLDNPKTPFFAYAAQRAA